MPIWLRTVLRSAGVAILCSSLTGCAAHTAIAWGIALTPLVPRTKNEPRRVPAESSIHAPSGSIPPCAAPAAKNCLPPAIYTTVNALQIKAERKKVQHYPSEIHPEFTLHTVEFDDQGWFWNRAAFEQAMTCIDEEARATRVSCPPPAGSPYARQVATRGAIIAVFAHGWEHNCDVCDQDVTCFRDTLRVVAKQENDFAKNFGVSPRRVIGVYVAWRGKSLVVPGYTKLDFWWRKETAHKIGYGQATELFTRLDHLHEKLTQDEKLEAGNLASKLAKGETVKLDPGQRSLLVYVGHSFGAALLYSSLSSVLASRMNEARESTDPIRGMGDLAVLVNPAFEALLYETFDQRTRAAGFQNGQPTLLMTVSSAGDIPTRFVFPFGRIISSIIQGARRREQWGAALTTVGNYKHDWTNTLDPARPPVPRAATKKEQGQCRCNERLDAYEKEISDRVQQWTDQVLTTGLTFAANQPTQFGPTVLNPYSPSRTSLDPSAPYLVLHADRAVIKTHGDIFNPTFITFLIEFITLHDLRANGAAMLKAKAAPKS